MILRCVIAILLLLPVITVSAQSAADTSLPKTTKMNEVMIRRDGYNYSDDTSRNYDLYRKNYRIINGKAYKLRDSNRQEGQYGLIIDGGVSQLINKLSGRKKRAQRTIDHLENDQKKRYVDTRYTPQLVHLVTNLSGDTLAHFMNLYPMTYFFATNAQELEFKMWIRDNYKDWDSKGRPMGQLADLKQAK